MSKGKRYIFLYRTTCNTHKQTPCAHTCQQSNTPRILPNSRRLTKTHSCPDNTSARGASDNAMPPSKTAVRQHYKSSTITYSHTGNQHIPNKTRTAQPNHENLLYGQSLMCDIREAQHIPGPGPVWNGMFPSRQRGNFTSHQQSENYQTPHNNIP